MDHPARRQAAAGRRRNGQPQRVTAEPLPTNGTYPWSIRLILPSGLEAVLPFFGDELTIPPRALKPSSRSARRIAAATLLPMMCAGCAAPP